MKAKLFLQRIFALSLSAALLLPALSVSAVTLDKSYTIYMVPNSHIDTSWMWPREHTAEKIVGPTFQREIDALKSNSSFKFSAPVSKHYEYLEKYYPDEFNQVKQMVANGQWDITGGEVVEPDLNIPSGEALVRQSLYAQNYFKTQLGKQAVTAYNPDAFGYNGQFPQIAKKSEMKYFVTSKLTWNDTNDFSTRPSELLYWQAIDGKSSLLTYLLPENYCNYYNEAMIENTLNGNQKQGSETGVKLGLGLWGLGDHGGGPTTQDYNSVAAMDSQSKVNVKIASATQYFQDTEQYIAQHPDTTKVRTQQGELYLEFHRGVYTSWSRVKKDNRQNEILAETAEKTATLNNWIGGVTTNSMSSISTAWDRILVNQMHDTISGTSAPYDYYVYFNNHELAKNLLTNVQNNALLGMAYRADTVVSDGVPVFVYNPLSWARGGEITAALQFGSLKNYVRVYDQNGTELPVNIVSRSGNSVTVSFLASSVPALGYEVFRAVTSDTAPVFDTDLSMQNNGTNGIVLENGALRLTIDTSTGNIKSLINKKDGNRELFDQDQEGNALHVYNDTGAPVDAAWNMVKNEFEDPNTPYVSIDQNPVIKVTENTKEKITVLVSKEWQGSTILQYITLAKGSQRVDVHMQVDWHNTNKTLKLSFPIKADAKNATYEIPYGALQRSTLRTNGTSEQRAQFEQCGQKWMDISNEVGASYGVSLLNDAKYGYDVYRMKDSKGQYYVRTRITVLRSTNSAPSSSFYFDSDENSTYQPNQQVIDNGFQEFNYAIYPHQSSWDKAQTTNQAEELCYPLQAIQPTQHDGGLGGAKSFLSVDETHKNVIIGAVKNPLESPDEKNTLIVRLYESTGHDTSNVRLTLPSGIVSAKEVNLLEHSYEGNKPLTYQTGGNTVTFNIGKYEILTLEIKLNGFTGSPVSLTQSAADLGSYYNLNGASDTANLTVGNLDGEGNSMPKDEWPSTVNYQGIRFQMGDVSRNNFVQASGQTVPLSSGSYSRVYLLGASAGSSPSSGSFTVHYSDGTSVSKALGFAAWNTDLSGWDRFTQMDEKPYVYDSVGYVFDHYYDGTKVHMDCDNYLFVYAIDVDPSKTVTGITLPDAQGIKIAAVTAANCEVPGFASVHEASSSVPVAPTGLATSLNSRQDVTISWTPSASENIVRYNIYGADSANFTPGASNLLGTVFGTKNSFTYTPETKLSLYFKVVAIDSSCERSAAAVTGAPVSVGQYDYCLDMNATASSPNPYIIANEEPAKAIDGKTLTTKWCSNKINDNNANGYGTLDVQLADASSAPKTVNRFRIYHCGSVENTSWNTRRYTVQTSLDGIAWTTSVAVESNDKNVTTYDVSPVACRYIRLNVLQGQQDFTNVARIYEFMAFGPDNIELPQPNVFAGAGVAYSNGSTNSNETADHIVDDNLSTKWCRQNTSPSNPGIAILKLNGTYSLNKIEVYHSTSNTSGGYDANSLLNTKEFKLEYSTDGINWAEAAHEMNNSAAVSTFRFTTPIMAQYVKITVLSPSSLTGSTNPTLAGDNAALRIVEVKGYGSLVTAGSTESDVLKGAVVTQSNGQTSQSESPEKMVDGDMSTKWCRQNTSSASPGVVVLALNGVYSLNRFEVCHSASNTVGGYDASPLLNTKEFKLEYSLDGSVWSQFDYETDNTGAVSICQPAAPVEAQFIRLTVLTPSSLTDATSPSLSQDNAALRIVELKAYGVMVYANPVETNVLKGASVVSSNGQTNQFESADHMVDGDMTTKWCRQNTSSASPGVAVLSLNGTYSLDKFEVYHCTSNPNPGGYDSNTLLNTKEFKLEYSPDGTSWSQVAYEANNTEAVSVYRLAAPVTAQYIRLTVLTPSSLTDATSPTLSQDNAALRIMELKAYGVPAIQPTATKVGTSLTASALYKALARQAVLPVQNVGLQTARVLKTQAAETVSAVFYNADTQATCPGVALITKDGGVKALQSGPAVATAALGNPDSIRILPAGTAPANDDTAQNPETGGDFPLLTAAVCAAALALAFVCRPKSLMKR